MGVWHSFLDWVMKEIAARRDINITIRFEYNHTRYEVVIPKGAKFTLDPKDLFYGPLKFNQMFGMKEI